MSTGESFSAASVGGVLSGWVRGAGLPVVLLHGGPGLSFEYLEGLADEIGAGFEIAAFQQRGLAPSTLVGPFTMSQAIDDVLTVIDRLDWPDAFVVGHSWGGHLALRFAAMHPERLRAALAIDPIGVVGDGGSAAFEVRWPPARRVGTVSECVRWTTVR